MRLLPFVSLVGLALSGVDAAPRGFSFRRQAHRHAVEEARPQDKDASQAEGLRNSRRVPVSKDFHQVVRRGVQHVANESTTPSSHKLVSVPLDAPSFKHERVAYPEDCPAPTVVISTTTVDVTVYVTPSEAVIQPSESDSSETVVTVPVSLTTTEPCDDDMTTTPGQIVPITTLTPVEEPCITGEDGMTTPVVEVSTPCPEETSTIGSDSGSGDATTPCDTTTTVASEEDMTTSVASSVVSSWWNMTTPRGSTTAPTTAMETPCDSSTLTFTNSSVVVVIPTPTPDASTTSYTTSSLGEESSTTIGVLVPSSSEPCESDSLTSASTAASESTPLVIPTPGGSSTVSIIVPSNNTSTPTTPCESDEITSTSAEASESTPFTTLTSVATSSDFSTDSGTTGEASSTSSFTTPCPEETYTSTTPCPDESGTPTPEAFF